MGDNTQRLINIQTGCNHLVYSTSPLLPLLHIRYQLTLRKELKDKLFLQPDMLL